MSAHAHAYRTNVGACRVHFRRRHFARDGVRRAAGSAAHAHASPAEADTFPIDRPTEQLRAVLRGSRPPLASGAGVRSLFAPAVTPGTGERSPVGERYPKNGTHRCRRPLAGRTCVCNACTRAAGRRFLLSAVVGANFH